MTDHLLHGLVLRTDVAVPGLSEAPAGRPVDIEVTLVGLRHVPDDAIAEGDRLQAVTWCKHMQYSTVGRPDGSVLLRLHGCVDFEVDADLRGVTAWRDPRCDPELYTLLVAGNLLATVLTLRGETVLHASAVERDGRAVAFVAHSGMGKSTLAALACARGARFLTDDLLRFEHRPDGRVHCLPGGLENRLRRPPAEILGFAPDGAHRVSVDERSVWRPEATTRPSAELVAVVLPQLDRGCQELEIAPLGRAAALLRLTATPRLLGWTGRAGRAAAFANLGALVTAVPVLAARVPWGLPWTPRWSMRFSGASACRSGRTSARAEVPRRLCPEHGGVAAVARHQRVVVAGLDDAAAVQHIDAVRVAHGREPVGDQQDRAVVQHLAEAREQRPLRLGVHGRGGLVEHDEARVAVDRARQRDPLPLADGEVGPARDQRAEHGVVAVWQGTDDPVRAGHRAASRTASSSPSIPRPTAMLSRALSWKRAKSWKITDTWSRAAAAVGPAITWPSHSTAPSAGSTRPARIFESVVLPEPFSPTSATISPRRISSDTPSSATRSEPG